jgi:hypothetical protein
MSGLVAALERPHPCPCDCHTTLTLAQRTQGIRAMFRFDDALRGWGYEPIYELGADRLYRAAQAANDAGYRGVAVRDHACIYRRFVGFAVHELLHALCGDVTRANYGMPFGLPYGVPLDVPEGDEAAYLDPFNRAEARAWLGVAVLAERLYGIDWSVYTARDVGTYGFAGGRAIVQVPAGYRPVPHWDRVHHRERYYALARKLEDEERAWFTPARVDELVARVEAAERAGAARRKQPWPRADELARLPPRLPGRNDPCLCGSGAKYKACCGAG